MFKWMRLRGIAPLKIAAVQPKDGTRHDFARPVPLLDALTKLSEVKKSSRA